MMNDAGFPNDMRPFFRLVNNGQPFLGQPFPWSRTVMTAPVPKDVPVS